MTTTTNLPVAPLPKAKRDLHPRAQLAYHQRAATRAQSKLEWLKELEARFPGDPNYRVSSDTVNTLHAKVLSHLRACIILNDDHDLGFLVTVSMRQMCGM